MLLVPREGNAVFRPCKCKPGDVHRVSVTQLLLVASWSSHPLLTRLVVKWPNFCSEEVLRWPKSEAREYFLCLQTSGCSNMDQAYPLSPCISTMS